MYNYAQFNNLINAIYEGPSEVPHWKSFLELFRDITGSTYAVLSFGSQAPFLERNIFIASHNKNLPSPNDSNNKKYLELSPFTDIPVNVVATLDEIQSTKSSLRRFQSQCLEPYNSHHMMGANIEKMDDNFCYFRIARNKTKGHYTDQHKQLCELLLPHIHRASSLWSPSQSNAIPQETLFNAMGSLGIGVIHLDSEKRILNINDFATQAIAGSSELMMPNGYFRLKNQEHNNLLAQVVRNTIIHQSEETSSFSINDYDNGEMLNFVFKRPERINQQSSVVIFLSSTKHQRNIGLPVLQTLFGLTPAEARISLALVNGSSIPEYAKSNNVSQNTAYTQLKSAFSKLGVNQQSMLVSLILGSVAPLGYSKH